MKIVIVGAGVSGMLAASLLRSKHEVILIEKNNECGKKILATGNGKCNFWHTNLRVECYETDYFSKLDKILMKGEECLNYLLSLGIYPMIKDGYYYPNSREASSIRDVLVNNLKGVKVLLNEEVKEINRDENNFIVKTDKQEITCDKVIVSSGSRASVKGCNTYNLLKPYHTINQVLPALVKLKCDNPYLTEWNGVRADASLELRINGKKKKDSHGEIQLTSDGISGICVFDISGEASKALDKSLNVSVIINFFPNKDFMQFMNERKIDETLINSLKTIFNKKLINIFLKESKISGNKKYHDLSREEKDRLCNVITRYRVNVTGNNGFTNAQVCTGGIPLEEVNEKTMESLKCKGLYLTGELLDVDGICGGYNMSFAFITGYLAASAINNRGK
ncbi:MAG: aminoacetone oxidase family FAD-binding enzyme [Bacilli bacterium]|nr:aminoacetone oxidase family FAD-binding enzyme [Bacilli bacterium]